MRTLSGWTGSAEYFQFREATTRDVSEVGRLLDAVLRRDVLGVVFRQWASTGECRRILRAFTESLDRRLRSSEAPSFYLGSYHYHRSPSEYVADGGPANAAVGHVLGREDPWSRFWHASAAGGRQSRLARFEGLEACGALIRSWSSQGEYALVPHEDYSQCVEPSQRGFEIQDAAARMCASNLCLANDGGAGRLIVWNLVPDDATRVAWGADVDGAPYPEDGLSAVPRQALDVHPGDLYVFNSRHIHAVEQQAGDRATIACLLGGLPDGEVIRWT